MFEHLTQDVSLMDVDVDTVCYDSGVEAGQGESAAPCIETPLNLMQLPDDAMHKILSSISSKQKLQSLPLVCKRMYVLLQGPSKAWQDVDTYTLCHLPWTDLETRSGMTVEVKRTRRYLRPPPKQPASPTKMRIRQQHMLRWMASVGPSVRWLKAAFQFPSAAPLEEQGSLPATPQGIAMQAAIEGFPHGYPQPLPSVPPQGPPQGALLQEPRNGSDQIVQLYNSPHAGGPSWNPFALGAPEAMQLDEQHQGGPSGPPWDVTPQHPFHALHPSFSTGHLGGQRQWFMDNHNKYSREKEQHKECLGADGWAQSESPMHRSKSFSGRKHSMNGHVPLMPRVASVFASLRGLRKLEVDYVSADNALLLCQLNQLTALSLGQLDDCAKVLAKHGNFPQLESFRLVNVRDQNETLGVSKGCTVFRYPKLRKLELFDCVTDITCCISTLTALTELRIANLLAGSKMNVATEIATLTQLKVLYIHAEHGCDIPAALSCLTQLSKMGMAGNCNMKALDGRIKELRQLKTLYLANMATIAWDQLLCQFQALPRLDTLSFEGCRLENLPPSVLLSTNLRALNLHNNLLEDLPHGPYLHRLQSIDLSHNYLSRVPEALAASPDLTWCDLSYNSNQSRQSCLTLDARGVELLTNAKQLEYCALVRYDETDKSKKLAEEHHKPWDNHELAALVQLTHNLASRKKAVVHVHNTAAGHPTTGCQCSVCTGYAAKGRVPSPVWF